MRAVIVCDLGFGDSGKGTITDYLVRRTGAKLVVRFCGGAQAAHHVVTPEGVTHCFSQYGSGTFAGAHTYLSRHVMVDPLALVNEYDALCTQVDVTHDLRLLVDVRAPLLTPWHKALNRLRELARGDARHGSCGMGIGELGYDLAHDLPVLRAGTLFRDLTRHVAVERAELVRAMKLVQAVELWPRVRQMAEAARLWQMMQTPASEWADAAHRAMRQARVLWVDGLADAVRSAGQDNTDGTLVFEGAQGVLLDEWAGFHPHTTWSRCTFDNAYELLDELGTATTHVPRTTVGVLRAFATRHGAGPFPTELAHGDDRWHDLARGEHNGTGEWQGSFRYGDFDAVLARYALDVVGGVDALVLTCVDRLPPGPFRYCDAYTHGAWDGPMARMEAPDRRDRDIKKQAELGLSLGWIKPVWAEAVGPIDGVERALGRTVSIVSAGPTAADKRETQAWTEAGRV